MMDKKTLGLAIIISWVLTLVTVLLLSSFAPSLTLPFTQQSVESDSVKVVMLEKQEVMNVSRGFGSGFKYLYLDFTWTPSNPTKNAILGIVCSFEYKVNAPAQTNWNLQFGIDVGIDVHRYQYSNEGLKIYNANEVWELTTFKTIPSISGSGYPNWIDPNQATYPIKLLLNVFGDAQTYIRNVNLMLLVIDG